MKQADNCVNADCPYQTGQPCQAATGCGGFMAESNDLVNALLKVSVETGSLVCLGCGYEHSCGTRGCAILREAVETLKAQDAEIAALRNPSPENKPLTVEELREMEGQPVWINGLNVWVLVSMDTGAPVFVFRDGGRVTAADCFDVDYAAYRHPPEKGE